MALEAPLRSSTGVFLSAHTYRPDMATNGNLDSNSTLSARPMSASFRTKSPSSGTYALVSPSDLVGPSPVTSVGTEIEDEMSEEVKNEKPKDGATQHDQPQLMMLSTNIPDHIRHTSTEESISVIHAPKSFQSWKSGDSTIQAQPPSEKSEQRSETSERSDVKSLDEPESKAESESDVNLTFNSLPPPPLSTDSLPKSYGDSPTPRAQTPADASLYNDPSRIRSGSTSSLELIPEVRGAETDAEGDDDFYDEPSDSEKAQRRGLMSALHEMWTLCNTLSTLSSVHRSRVFSNSGTPDAHQKAWKSCWRLCQRLYENWDAPAESLSIRAQLDLCRNFCLALFEVRQRQDIVADSVLRVSFELNNHLFTAQDSRYPDVFHHRTLDFYITLCHRLMKQRTELAAETDRLLWACWNLAENLFNLRQLKRDGKQPDIETLSLAVQSCWHLCNIFKNDWAHDLPDPERGTPRPNQTAFPWAFPNDPHLSQQQQQAQYAQQQHAMPYGQQQPMMPYGQQPQMQYGQQPPLQYQQPPMQTQYASQPMSNGNISSNISRSDSRVSMHSNAESGRSSRTEMAAPQRPSAPVPPIPETPVTEFEDTPISPDLSPNPASLMVLGSTMTAPMGRWSSAASNLSRTSHGSRGSSSTKASNMTAGALAALSGEDVNHVRIKLLVLKIAMQVGFSREAASGSDGMSGSQALQSFVKGLPLGTFGSLPSHANLLQNYKNLVLTDPLMRGSGQLPPRVKRIAASDMAGSINWMIMRHSKYGFLKDLFKLAFQFHIEEVELRKSASIQI